MKYIFTIIFFSFFNSFYSQITCESINQLGTAYKQIDHRNGRGRLFNTDTAITNKMKWKTLELRAAGSLTEAEKKELKKYNISFNPTDTIIFYDWDVMHQGKMGYHGKAVAQIWINCSDSMITLHKYLLRKGTTNYVPNRFKIFKMHDNDFILSDRNHAYLNINIYFKKD